MKKSGKWQLVGWLLYAVAAVAESTIPSSARPILVKPVTGLEGFPINSVSFWWKYHDDPDISKEIEKQVMRNALVLAEVPGNGRFFPAKYVGKCIFSSNSWEMRSFGARTFASSAECGQTLKPNQWYRWSAWTYFRDGNRLAQTGYFQTGEHSDIIVDTPDAGFTTGGTKPWDDRRLGYSGHSLLTTTTMAETETNHCQWEWHISQEGTYEVSVHLLPRYWGNPSVATSEQVSYKLWREGIVAPNYKSVKTIDQTQDYGDQWASLGTFYFKVGSATLRLTDNTGESVSLGRQLVCDAVRVRARLGTPELISSYLNKPFVKRGTRAGSPDQAFSPRNGDVILSSQPEIGFRWNTINGATNYRLQISKQKFENHTSENALDSQPCDHCIEVKTPTSTIDSVDLPGNFEFDTPYYWRVRAENYYYQPVRFSFWSEVRQFTVMEAPTGGGQYPVKCQEFKQPEGIKFKPPYKDTLSLSGKEIIINSTAAWAHICYPEAGNNWPVVLFLHGNSYNCTRICDHPACTDKEKGQQVGYHDWDGKFRRFPDGTKVEIIPPGTCETENIIENHRGFDYLLEELASHGIFAMSVNTHDIQGNLDTWNITARAEILIQFIGKLKDWNANGTDPFGGIFKDQLNLKNIGLAGHSRGGEALLTLQNWLVDDELWKDDSVSIVAISAIAPTNYDSMEAEHSPYYLLLGARDNDVVTLTGLRVYQETPNSNVPKMKAIAYGANHNYFNTVWTQDDAAGIGVNPMTPAEQQEIALTTLTAFFRWHLQGEKKYQGLFTNWYYKHDRLYGSYDAGTDNRLAVDDFELIPNNHGFGYQVSDPTTNPLEGKNSCTDGWLIDSCEFEEMLLTYDSSDLGPYERTYGLKTDHHFFEYTIGMRLNWTVSALGTTAVYRTEIPEGAVTKALDKTDLPLSQLTHLSLQAANVEPGDEIPLDSDIQTSVNLAITLEIKDGVTIRRSRPVEIKDFGRIPHPYQRKWLGECSTCTENQQAVLVGIRIPLSEFGFSTAELNHLSAIEIEMDGQGNSKGNIALDDIVLTK